MHYILGLLLYSLVLFYHLFTVSVKEKILSKNIEEFISKNDNLSLVNYFEQFFVGLLEADSTITVDYISDNKKRVRIFIAIKNTVENKLMLNLFVKYIGGRVAIERSEKYVTWYATSRIDLNKVLAILEKYPFLSIRKQCQLEFAKKFLYSTEAISKEEFIQLRDNKYKDRDQMLDYVSEVVFLRYFPAWLSGFIEGEGHFKLVKSPSGSIKSSQFIIGQNNEKHILKAILMYFNSETNKIGYVKNKEGVLHYRIYIAGREFRKLIVSHFDAYPLLGDKNLKFLDWISKH